VERRYSEASSNLQWQFQKSSREARQKFPDFDRLLRKELPEGQRRPSAWPARRPGDMQQFGFGPEEGRLLAPAKVLEDDSSMSVNAALAFIIACGTRVTRS
jgi:hypothetical protein